MKIILRIIQGIIILSPFVLLGWLFIVNFVPSGQAAKSFDFSAASPYVDHLVPQERVTGVMRENGKYFQQILNEPVYFHVHLPSSFEKMVVGIEFMPNGQPFIEFGPLVNEETWQSELRPLWNETLENLNWIVKEDNGTRLFQRRNAYQSVDDFLTNPPPIEEVAVYDYDLEVDYEPAGYAPTREYREYELFLRGYHQFLTYIGAGEDIDFSFWFQDMNRGEGADPIVINLYADNEIIDSKIIPDGEIWRGFHEGSPTREVNFKKSGLEPGVYKIELNVPADIFVRKIRTPQQKIVVVNTVFLGDEVGYQENEKSTTLWTDASYIVAETMHADGTQELRTNGELFPISESHKEFYREFFANENLNEVFSPQGDIKITGNGLFAWDKNLFFNPYPFKLDANSNLDAQKISYVITGYEPAERRGDWYYHEEEFDLSVVPATGGTIKFSISAPGVSRRQANPAVSEVDLVFMREPIGIENWHEVFSKYISKAIEKIFKLQESRN